MLESAGDDRGPEGSVMSGATTPRYGHPPTAAFAATRAIADLRRAREASVAMVSNGGEPASRSKQVQLWIATLLKGATLAG